MSVETDLLASVVEVIAQSLVYGVFVILMPISTVILMKRGWKTRHGMLLLGMVWIMFALSTAHWVANLAFLVTKVKTLALVNGTSRATSDLVNAIVTINLGIADAVVLWRAWVLCRDTFRKLLLAAYVFLGLTTVGIMVTIALRITINAQVDGQGRESRSSPVVQALDLVQVASIGLSAFTNLASTSIVAAHVWRYRRFLRENFEKRQSTRVERVLVLLVESGIFYSIYAIISIICSVFRISIGTVGDVTNTVLVHISGVYPTFIITLVSVQGTITSTTLSPPFTSGGVEGARDNTTLIFAHPSAVTSARLELDLDSKTGSFSPRMSIMWTPTAGGQFLHEDPTRKEIPWKAPDYRIDTRQTV